MLFQPFRKKYSKKAQNAIEYLMIFALTVGVMVVAFQPGGVFDENVTGSLDIALDAFECTASTACFDATCTPVCSNGCCETGENAGEPFACSQDCGFVPSCGDSSCDTPSETCGNCPSDCGSCAPFCGDGVCNNAETRCSCPSDGCPDSCGDGCCTGSETVCSCPADGCLDVCGDGCCTGTETICTCSNIADGCAPVCGDGCCTNPPENNTNCSGECGVVCGDGVCTGGETKCSCAADCLPDFCGDGCCTGSETSATCLADCPAVCPDGLCTGSETKCSCAADCPVDFCGDGCCTGSETNASCAADCPVVCSDGFCAPSENCLSCGADCGCTAPDTCDATGTCVCIPISPCGQGFCGLQPDNCGGPDIDCGTDCGCYEQSWVTGWGQPPCTGTCPPSVLSATCDTPGTECTVCEIHPSNPSGFGWRVFTYRCDAVCDSSCSPDVNRESSPCFSPFPWWGDWTYACGIPNDNCGTPIPSAGSCGACAVGTCTYLDPDHSQCVGSSTCSAPGFWQDGCENAAPNTAANVGDRRNGTCEPGSLRAFGPCEIECESIGSWLNITPCD